MADRCPGSYLMRRDLYETFAKLGKLPLAKEEDSPLRLLCLALYWHLVDKVHCFSFGESSDSADRTSVLQKVWTGIIYSFMHHGRTYC